jgi:hypothetical protein
MSTPREEALAWIERSLVSEFPEEAAATPETLRHFGESLLLIAEKYQVPVDEAGAIWWIHNAPGKERSLVAWRAWCEEYAEKYAELRGRETAMAAKLPRFSAIEEIER